MSTAKYAYQPQKKTQQTKFITNLTANIPHSSPPGALMIIAFCFCFPMAVFFGLMKRRITGEALLYGEAAWYQIHRGFIAAGLLFAFPAFMIAITSFEVRTIERGL